MGRDVAAGRGRHAGRHDHERGPWMTQCETIAIVDDDIAVCSAVSRVLEVHGYVTEQYSSAEEFVCAVTRTAASCLVIDINLGDITGVELGRQLSAMGIKLPIIFIS